MLKMRLQRRGKRNYATYRVVIAEQRAPIKGRFVADIGFYNPHTDQFNVDHEKVTQWLQNGVRPSPTVHNLLVDNGVIKAEKVTSWRPKVKKEEEKEKTPNSPDDKKNESPEVTAEKATEEIKEEPEEKKEEK